MLKKQTEQCQILQREFKKYIWPKKNCLTFSGDFPTSDLAVLSHLIYQSEWKEKWAILYAEYPVLKASSSKCRAFTGDALLRWMGEPVKAVILPTSTVIILTSAANIPTACLLMELLEIAPFV